MLNDLTISGFSRLSSGADGKRRVTGGLVSTITYDEANKLLYGTFAGREDTILTAEKTRNAIPDELKGLNMRDKIEIHSGSNSSKRTPAFRHHDRQSAYITEPSGTVLPPAKNLGSGDGHRALKLDP
jgi:hypothetical protein